MRWWPRTRHGVVLGFVVLSSGCGGVVRQDTDAGEADAALAPPTQLALAQGDIVAVLGSAGTDATDVCPSGQALVGYSGAATMITGPDGPTAVVAQVVAHCGIIHVESLPSAGYAVGASTGVALTARGMDTATHWELRCPADQFVVGLAVRAGTALDQLASQCAPVSLVANSGIWNGQVGTPTSLGPVGGDGGKALSGACPAGQIATMSNTRVLTAPVIMGGIGLGCSTVLGH
jgi:hypothetical protein